MKHLLHTLVALLLPACLLAQEATETKPSKPVPRTPAIQLTGGVVYSSIDLSRYTSSIAYRGHHLRTTFHLKGLFFISGEYSKFKHHDSPSAWQNASAQKIDLNTQCSFATNNNLTRIFVLAGFNRHQWQAERTGYTDNSQLATGIPAGEIVKVDRLGINVGCGFTQTLYENIGVFGDYRFCFGKSAGFEKVRIMDVMTVIGVNLSFPYPDKKRKHSIGGKIYKWTKKGA